MDLPSRPPRTPGSPALRAAWSTTLIRLLPSPPARILSIGASTGFLSLTLARLGYRVTVLDPAEDATDPPTGDFDAVTEQHALLTMLDPAAALSAWLEAAPAGRLALFESLSAGPNHPVEEARASRRELLRRLRDPEADHQGSYTPEPRAARTTPEQLADLVAATGWGPAQIHRLTDVEWACAQDLPPLERLYGVTPCFGIVADAVSLRAPRPEY